MNHTRFILDQRRGSACKTTCPVCGQKKCFKLYVDTETGEPLDESCGRCDHEQSCGYHYKPHELFRDRPDIKERYFPSAEKLTFLSQVLPVKPVSHPASPPPLVATFPMWMVEQRHRPDGSFMPWLQNHIGSEDAVQRVFDAYWLGTTREGVYQRLPIIFWYIDIRGVVRDGKILWYKADGHREQYMNWISARMIKAKLLPENAVTSKCLFGEHLLSQYPEAIVMVVEGEKSAVFLSCLFSEYVWLATGGCGGLNDEKLEALKGRKVVFLPDSGEYDKWCKVLSESPNAKAFDYRVSKALEVYPKNTDLVDVQLGEVKPITVSPPNTVETILQEMVEDNPCIEELMSIFDLQPESFRRIKKR